MIKEELKAYIEKLRKEHSTYSIKAEYGNNSAKAKAALLENVIAELNEICEVKGSVGTLIDARSTVDAIPIEWIERSIPFQHPDDRDILISMIEVWRDTMVERCK